MRRMNTIARPRQVFCYTQKKGEVLFDESGLGGAVVIPKWLEQGKSHKRWDLQAGLAEFTPYTIPKEVSTVKNLLITMVEYEKRNSKATEEKEPKDNSGEDDLASLLKDLSIKDKGTILTHNGLFTDIVLRSKDVYNVIFYRGYYIFANTSRREGQQKYFAYIGLKFENLLKNDASIPNNDHFKILLNGTIGGAPFYSVAEIDGVKKGYKADLPYEEKTNHYMEVKLCLTQQAPKFQASATEMDKLFWLRSNVNHFETKCKKWLFQSYFARQDTILVGTRNRMSFVTGAFIVNVDTLVAFVKKVYPGAYQKFVRKDETLALTCKKIMDFVDAHKCENEKENVFSYDVKTGHIIKQDSETAERVFDNSIVPEFRAWKESHS